MPTTTLSITNPATGALVLRVAADGPREVAARYAAARAAQPRWAATPMRRRIAAIEKFRELIIARTDALANTLTQEVGKPIRQSRNELKGLIGRLDFFIAESARALREQKVFVDAAQKLDERITHEPLGVVANISAWNYPYFVGSNVFVPALVAGNTVLYKTCCMRPASRRTCSYRSSAAVRPVRRCCDNRSTAYSSPARTLPAQRLPQVLRSG